MPILFGYLFAKEVLTLCIFNNSTCMSNQILLFMLMFYSLSRNNSLWVTITSNTKLDHFGAKHPCKGAKNNEITFPSIKKIITCL